MFTNFRCHIDIWSIDNNIKYIGDEKRGYVAASCPSASIQNVEVALQANNFARRKGCIADLHLKSELHYIVLFSALSKTGYYRITNCIA